MYALGKVLHLIHQPLADAFCCLANSRPQRLLLPGGLGRLLPRRLLPRAVGYWLLPSAFGCLRLLPPCLLRRPCRLLPGACLLPTALLPLLFLCSPVPHWLWWWSVLWAWWDTLLLLVFPRRTYHQLDLCIWRSGHGSPNGTIILREPHNYTCINLLLDAGLCYVVVLEPHIQRNPLSAKRPSIVAFNCLHDHIKALGRHSAI
mmetsp:Transcript_59078/g.103396  ORF Transcript_59078/g.103396 Transcript_59078/m.103396 type:complete len:203 (+) Transcript_59078:277-885(+)